MTDTITNVPREMLERVLYLMDNYIGTTHTEEDELRALLSAPSPAGVDGLKRYEVFPYLDDDVAELDICESDDGTFVKYAAAQAIIDGLRGENERIRLNIAEYNEAIACYQSERDQQARRIGELEGLLYEASGELRTDRHHGLGPRIDAALPAGKEGE